MGLVDAITAHARQERNLDVVADDVRYGDWHESVEESMRNAIFLFLADRFLHIAAVVSFRGSGREAKRDPDGGCGRARRVEPRAFPYLGNIPSIRWTGTNAEEVVDLAIQEWLRLLHARTRFESLREIGRIPATARLLCRPPELLDCHGNDVPRKRPPALRPWLSIPTRPSASRNSAFSRLWPSVTFVTPTGAGRPQPPWTAASGSRYPNRRT